MERSSILFQKLQKAVVEEWEKLSTIIVKAILPVWQEGMML